MECLIELGQLDPKLASQSLVSADADSSVRIWRGLFWRGLTGLRREVCALTGMRLSRAQWNQYAPGVGYQLTCPGSSDPS
jgi:hypothetical protein